MARIKMGPCDYNGGAPRGYQCGTCGATCVKLWREYQTMMATQELYCAKCAVERAGGGEEVDDDGRWRAPDADYKTDTVSWRVPAVPTAEGDTFWGYTSVPPEGVAWWKRLPTRLTPAKVVRG